jgi:hypothetical protein
MEIGRSRQKQLKNKLVLSQRKNVVMISELNKRIDVKSKCQRAVGSKHLVTTDFSPLYVHDFRLSAVGTDIYLLWAEPTVLLTIHRFFQRTKVSRQMRDYNISQGYASQLCRKKVFTIRQLIIDMRLVKSNYGNKIETN